MSTNKQPQKSGLFGRFFKSDKTEHEPEKSQDVSQESVQQDSAEALENISPASASLQDLDTAAPVIDPPDTPPAPVQDIVQEKAQDKKKSWFGRLKDGLSKSSTQLSESLTGLFTKAKLDEETLQDLEDLLIQADLGVETAMRVTDALAKTRQDKNISAEEVKHILAQEVENVLAPVAQPLELQSQHCPHVILTVGVNGSGKTTTIGKLAQKYRTEGKEVMLAAGDTFRAAAVEQLKIWGERTGSPVITREHGSDAASLAFDALEQAKAQQSDVLLIDTAGRLQNKTNLMAELEKIVRVIQKFDERAPHTVLLVLDATTGQNALSQVELFSKSAGVSGLIMTKLDGTARGGILVAIADKYELPIHAIGVGEGIDDLQPFKANEFAQAIVGN
ncbi:MAG: signal recognition particle-docking protein FtsY [Pseudomonadota bacterium]